MPKTRRTKHNAKAPLKSRNIKLIEIGSAWINPNRGGLIPVKEFTGIPRGKNYPYASARRGGRAVPDLRLAPRNTVAVVDGR